jgi:hypothetical protein
MLKVWHKSKKNLHVQSIQTSRVDNPCFFQTSFFLPNVHHSFWKLKRILTLMIRRAKKLEPMTIVFITHLSTFGSKVFLSQPYFGQVWGWSPTLGKSEDLESPGTPECSELDSKAQNTLHWGVLGVIGKVLKRRYRKWPRIGHLDICRPSYGQKKGREWQFDSRPLKVGNRPLPDLRIESAIRRWKDDDESYKFGLDLVAIRLCSRELWAPKVPGLHPGQFRDNFGTPTWESREKEPFGCSPRNVAQRILYKGEGGGFPQVRAVVSLVVQSARGLSQHPRVSRNVD